MLLIKKPKCWNPGYEVQRTVIYQLVVLIAAKD